MPCRERAVELVGERGEQAAALAARTAAHAPLDNPDGVAYLLHRMRDVGAHQQAAVLIGRLPTVGMFGLFLEQKGSADQFRFGREADGTPAAPWGWEDLDLWLVPTAGTVRRPALHSHGGSRVAMMDRYLIRQAARPPGNPRRAVGALARDRPPAQTVSTVRPAARFKIETLPSRYLCQSQNSAAVDSCL
jgi:hypothetical protein